MKKKLGLLFDKLVVSIAILLGLLTVFMMLIISADVSTRLILGTQILPGTTEICEWIILVVPFLGGAWVLRNDGHVRMDIVINKFSNRTQDLLRTITSSLSAIACTIFSYFVFQNGWKDAITGYYKLSVMNLPRAPFEFIMVFGLILLTIEFIRMAYRSGVSYKSGILWRDLPK